MNIYIFLKKILINNYIKYIYIKYNYKMLNNNNINDEESRQNEELDYAAEIIQNASFLYLQKKRQNEDKDKQLKLLKTNIHDILFENKSIIQEGIYLKLMNLIKY
tara:strand:- start:1009 stop:1323 length:315 start_codon:yes stop_codon:yes gene_type:complete